MDNPGPLEIFARLQHHGAPTRLIDITKNPYIAAWFAVEQDEEPGVDSRLFALATTAPRADGSPNQDQPVRESDLVRVGQPIWHGFETAAQRGEAEWGTGAFRRVWVPPTYDPRIAAQNAGFVLDGVPVTSQSVASYFKKGSSSQYWKRADLLAAGSIYIKMERPSRAARPTKANLAPTFSWRIASEARHELRTFLEDTFSYTRAAMYPDVSGLSTYLLDGFPTVASPLYDGST